MRIVGLWLSWLGDKVRVSLTIIISVKCFEESVQVSNVVQVNFHTVHFQHVLHEVLRLCNRTREIVW